MEGSEQDQLSGRRKAGLVCWLKSIASPCVGMLVQARLCFDQVQHMSFLKPHLRCITDITLCDHLSSDAGCGGMSWPGVQPTSKPPCRGVQMPAQTLRRLLLMTRIATVRSHACPPACLPVRTCTARHRVHTRTCAQTYICTLAHLQTHLSACPTAQQSVTIQLRFFEHHSK